MTKEARRAQMPLFAWLLALMIGALVLFFAFYVSGGLGRVARLEREAVIVKDIGMLLDAFVAIGGLGEVSMAKPIELPFEAEIKLECEEPSKKYPLGYQPVWLRTKGKTEWTGPDKIHNKYVFARRLEGKRVEGFSKPLRLPWRIDDLVYVFDRPYCFLGELPDEVEEELRSPVFANLTYISFNAGDCAGGKGLTVCSATDCDIRINAAARTVNGKSYVTPTLFYAAVFSDPAIYECNVARLKKRLALQADLLSYKAAKLPPECQVGLAVTSGLNSLRGAETMRLSAIKSVADSLESANRALVCRLF